MKFKQITLFAYCISLFFYSVSTIAKPHRVVSLNLCADQLLMALLPPKNLVGITQLASDPDASYLYQQASRFHQHTSRIEEIIALKPDLIVAGAFTSQPTNQLLESLGYPVIKLGLPTTIEEIFQQINFLAERLGQQSKANELIAAMRQELIKIENNRNKNSPRAVVYYANGFSAGRNTIVNEILTLAGFKNVATELGLDHIAPLSLESLLASKPDILLLGQLDENTDSLAQQVLRHRAIVRYAALKQVQKIMVPERYWSCAGPSTIAAASYLQQGVNKVTH